MIANLRVGLVAVLVLLATLAVWPVQALAIRAGWPLARRLPLLWHRLAAPLVGLRVSVRGSPAAGRPLLLVANHQSWADIVALGSVMELSFIAKAEVRDWPAFGLLARLQRTVFVEREERGRTRHQADAIAERLTAGDVMVLFAEGTTSDGNGVLPFKSALFGAAQSALKRSNREAVLVQPVAIAFTRVHGMPLGRFLRPLAAWPGDVELVPHLLGFLREGAFDVEVSFGAPIPFTQASDRKRVAREAETAVARLLAASLQGSGVSPTNETALASPPGRVDIGASKPSARQGQPQQDR